MTPEIQTLLSLLVVALAAAGLVWRAYRKRKHHGCGSDCGAVSPEMKKLQARLTRK
jgi:hypothetical protein